jgi:CMP-N,N'-diacetyllegionaminic acid synthase
MIKQILNITVFLVYKSKSFLAIIPARGGSKRLPRKNLLDLNGKPLIAWSIESGLKSEYIDKVIVSSDDDEILSISKKYKSDTIVRPSELASDTATTFDVIKHVIDNTERYDYIVLLQPTSPLRDEGHIDESIKLLELKNSDAVVSVCETDHSPLWSNTLDDSLLMEGFLRDEILNKRSQDLEKYYRLNGAIYICDTKKLLKEERFFIDKNIYAFKMNRATSVDIDNEIDFQLADLIMKEKHYW